MRRIERKKTYKLVITFPTTTAAMTMDAVCDAGKGRLIPIPGEISAGCGLAWCSEPELEDELLTLMSEHDISYQEKHTIELH